ncbi:MAG: histidine phosphatase family protein [Sphingobacteriaceae bacterium]
MSASKVYLVRHAEKASQTDPNPNLSEEGRARALALSKLLKHKNIGLIYATKYKRSIETASPVANLKKVPIKIYTPDTAATIIKIAFKQKKDVLIVGHSNTLLPLLQEVGLHPSMSSIADDQYSLLFVVYQRGGKLVLEERSYPKPEL